MRPSTETTAPEQAGTAVCVHLKQQSATLKT